MSYFPKDFLWGTACASYQCEGGYLEDGKGLNIWDEFVRVPGAIKNADTGDVACDSYHRFREDVALMKAHNIPAYRFSISWARVIPDGSGEINPKGLAFYDALVDELIAAGIEPMITLYHWDLPVALQNKGGWLNRDIVEVFGRYAQIIAEHFKGRVKTYMTINEPQCVAVLGYSSGIHAPGWNLPDCKLPEIYHNLCLAHSEAQRRIKAAAGQETVVGVVTCGRLCYPLEETPEAEEGAYKATFDLTEDWLFTANIFLDGLLLHRYDEDIHPIIRDFLKTVPDSDWDLMEKPDFLGVNVYQGEPADENGKLSRVPTGFARTATKWKVTPEILYYGPKFLHRRYGLPMIITENGLSCNDRIYLDGKVHDVERIDFLTRYLRQLSRGIQEGIPVNGYLHWSFLDNFEWSEGYLERFGMIYVDYATCDRTPKDSAKWYGEVIRTNGEILG